MQRYSQAVHDKGAALYCCWGFIDGTVRPVYRPGQNHRFLYNGHEPVHSIKYKSVVTPNGLIANLYGPMEGRRHDRAFTPNQADFNKSMSTVRISVEWIFGDIINYC